MDLADIREHYTRGALDENELTDSPLTLFDRWIEDVIASKMPDANAMTLATVDTQGRPTQRIVLLKGRPDDKFVFFTNYGSNKAQDIDNNPHVSLHFPWYVMERQVMVTGIATKLSEQENYEYFSTRPKDSQIGALVSQQSAPLDSRESLVSAFKAAQQDYANTDVPMPNWGGYSVTPLQIEFWQGGSHRLHDRFRYTREDAQSPWHAQRLNP